MWSNCSMCLVIHVMYPRRVPHQWKRFPRVAWLGGSLRGQRRGHLSSLSGSALAGALHSPYQRCIRLGACPRLFPRSRIVSVWRLERLWRQSVHLAKSADVVIRRARGPCWHHRSIKRRLLVWRLKNLNRQKRKSSNLVKADIRITNVK